VCVCVCLSAPLLHLFPSPFSSTWRKPSARCQSSQKRAWHLCALYSATMRRYPADLLWLSYFSDTSPLLFPRKMSVIFLFLLTWDMWSHRAVVCALALSRRMSFLFAQKRKSWHCLCRPPKQNWLWINFQRTLFARASSIERVVRVMKCASTLKLQKVTHSNIYEIHYMGVESTFVQFQLTLIKRKT